MVEKSRDFLKQKKAGEFSIHETKRIEIMWYYLSSVTFFLFLIDWFIDSALIR